jgi:nucleoside-diphosphate-sugar epimerase
MSADILIIGGSGFISGTISRLALAQGHRVWTVTRGQRPLPEGVTGIVADRTEREGFASAIAGAKREWDLVVDCIGYERGDAVQDVELFRDRARQFVFISTDYVHAPDQRTFPQRDDNTSYLTESYGGKKRLCELEFINGDTGAMQWSVIRPCHVYGPGSLLGCFPLHGRDPELLNRMRREEPLTIVGAGYFLLQPIYVDDLAQMTLSVIGNAAAHEGFFYGVGPEVIDCRGYYRIIADVLGVGLTIHEKSVSEYLAETPPPYPHICHHFYDTGATRDKGLRYPATTMAEGLRKHVESLLG